VARQPPVFGLPVSSGERTVTKPSGEVERCRMAESWSMLPSLRRVFSDRHTFARGTTMKQSSEESDEVDDDDESLENLLRREERWRVLFDLARLLLLLLLLLRVRWLLRESEELLDLELRRPWRR
jgi:hypothetical protein